MKKFFAYVSASGNVTIFLVKKKETNFTHGFNLYKEEMKYLKTIEFKEVKNYITNEINKMTLPIFKKVKSLEILFDPYFLYEEEQ